MPDAERDALRTELAEALAADLGDRPQRCGHSSAPMCCPYENFPTLAEFFRPAETPPVPDDFDPWDTSFIPPAEPCRECGPGYRVGDEGCRHGSAALGGPTGREGGGRAEMVARVEVLEKALADVTRLATLFLDSISIERQGMAEDVLEVIRAALGEPTGHEGGDDRA